MPPSSPVRSLSTGRGHWLLKSEPDVFSYTDLVRVGREPWNGVRNYQARNFLRQMAVGDGCLFYHSNAKPPGVVGVAQVVRAAYPDDLQFDPRSEFFDPRADPAAPRWSMVDIMPVRALPRPLPLDELRQLPAWHDSPLLRRGARLSVIPVTPEQWQEALATVGATPPEVV